MDDDPAVRRILKLTLRQRGHTLIAGDSGQDAIRILSREGERITLVVTDYEMPNGRGAEIMHKVWESFPRTPVLLSSGHNDPFEGIQVETAPFALLRKPFTAETFADAVPLLLACS